MADHSHIEWTDATWNPITGCSVTSPGCANCYAMKLAGTRLRNHPSRKGLTKVVNGRSVWTGEVRFNEAWLHQPLKWKAARQIFVCAHGDLFHPDVPAKWIDAVYDVMERAPQHEYQVLTKRSARMAAYVSKRYAGHAPLRYILHGVSVENQEWADKRRGDLARVSSLGWRTFCSYEPALGAIDWAGWDFLDWLISGGESGDRPCHPDWMREARDFCATYGIAYLHKQNGSWSVIVDRECDDPDWRADYGVINRKPDYRILNLAGGHGFHGERVLLMRRVGKALAGRLLDGRTHDEFPEVRT